MTSFSQRMSWRAGWIRRPLTETERNWLRAALLMLGSILFFSIIYTLEKNLGRWNADIRLVRNPAGAAMILLGIPHFLIALLYTVTSKSMRSVSAWARFSGMAALGVLLCAGYLRLDRISASFAATFFLAYFLLHDFRDQIFFYFTNKDVGPVKDRVALGRFLLWTPFFAAGLVVVLLVASILLAAPGTARAREVLAAIPALERWGTLAIVLLFTLLAGLRMKRSWSHASFAPPTRLRSHRPIHLVFGGTLLILSVGLLAGWRTYTVVILHVTAWYVFTVAQLKRRKDPPAFSIRSSFRWLRSTPAGFRVLHVGLAVLMVLAGLVWAYGYRNAAVALPAWLLLDAENFPLWTILHVTVSFRPR